ncbi:P-loop containing nucleoside triphosphate hydrolase protein [Epithele typhae]|uniref:P-loop containing nucleoside triphosphate hydrolase protein n=1 Tax=Epithele typhae TaxID=378194 RepID=UPI00200892A0|nr:P-loop containing nucleoside triphosphate hydrolase protein [Epithele typhae]KAH9934528.1 P-loop containing nucleoside triphosphate hydrolase protein [Epithele typhae]
MSEKQGQPVPASTSFRDAPQRRYRRHSAGLFPVDDSLDDDEASTAALFSPAAPPPPAVLKVKRVDYYYSTWSKVWKYRNTSAKVRADALLTVVGNGNEGNADDAWAGYCFVVVRKIPQPTTDGQQGEPTFQVVVKSPYLLAACKEVMGKIQGVSWTAEPLELDPLLLLAFLPRFEAYRDDLTRKTSRTLQDDNILKTVNALLEYLHKDYAATLSKLTNLMEHGEITFDTLFAIFVPRSILVADCPITGEPRAFELVSAQKLTAVSGGVYDLICESVDASHDEDPAAAADEDGAPAGHRAAFNPALSSNLANVMSLPPMMHPPPPGNDWGLQRASGKTFGRVQSRVFVPFFKGTVKVNSLDVYPIGYHANAGALETALVARGRKWLALRGVHHMHYVGPATYTLSTGMGKKSIKYNVKSRVMIDKANFRRLNPSYEMPAVKMEATPNNPPPGNVPGSWGRYSPPPVQYNPNACVPTFQARAKMPREKDELTDDELMLAPSIVYGFSLADKAWLEFNIERVQPVTWNDEAFENLVIPADRKALLQSLVDAHSVNTGFDDFIEGKGRGLVFNLFGPPGVGKTLSAEATSEHVRRPLYVVGGGDLGTSAATLDAALNTVFDLATAWHALVLIDEADVFLEERSLHDLERNAMVAVFLRHVEYYRGILFLTTNRVRAFDEAFLSRIHVALHFRELDRDARRQVWAAFLRRAGPGAAAVAGSAEALDALAARALNGRQIKNAVRTASSLAGSRGVPLRLEHLAGTLDTMDEFSAEFAGPGRK